MRVTVIDYKAGNLTSVLKALRHLGAEAEVTDGDLAPIERAERIVLPGVGHFAATQRLDATGLTAAIRAAIARGVPFSASVSVCSGSTRDQRSARAAGPRTFHGIVYAFLGEQRKSPARRMEFAGNPP